MDDIKEIRRNIEKAKKWNLESQYLSIIAIVLSAIALIGFFLCYIDLLGKRTVNFIQLISIRRFYIVTHFLKESIFIFH